MSVLFGGSTLTGTRFAPGSYVNGKWVEGLGTPITISGTVQPVPGSILQTLPEGKRELDLKLLVTDSPLNITDPMTGISGDIIVIEGSNWQVESVQPWQNGIMPHHEYLLIRAKEGA